MIPRYEAEELLKAVDEMEKSEERENHHDEMLGMLADVRGFIQARMAASSLNNSVGG